MNFGYLRRNFADGEIVAIIHWYFNTSVFQIKTIAKENKGNFQKIGFEPKSGEVLSNEKAATPITSCEFISSARMLYYILLLLIVIYQYVQFILYEF